MNINYASKRNSFVALWPLVLTLGSTLHPAREISRKYVISPIKEWLSFIHIHLIRFILNTFTCVVYIICMSIY